MREKKTNRQRWKRKRRCDKGKTLIHESLELLEGILRNNKAHFFVLVREWRKAKTPEEEKREEKWVFFCLVVFVALASLTHYLECLHCLTVTDTVLHTKVWCYMQSFHLMYCTVSESEVDSYTDRYTQDSINHAINPSLSLSLTHKHSLY